MPLTKHGSKVLRRFRAEYGKRKGERVFYAYMRSHPNITRSWHKKVRR